jgi:hypothetical protein
MGWEIFSWEERLERSEAIERLERLERSSLRARHIRQHRKKHQSQVQRPKTLGFYLIPYPFAFILL